MTKRYYAATDGNVTVFRATGRTYGSAFFVAKVDLDTGLPHARNISFSASMGHPGHHSVVEITKSEFDALQALKVQRILAVGGNPAIFVSPQDSWVRNSALADGGLEHLWK